MKKLTLVLIVSISIIAISKTTLFTYSSGAPSARTSAPGEKNCTECHSGTASTSGVTILATTTSGQVTSYQPNQNIFISVSVNKPGKMKFGFELTALAGTQHVGTFSIVDPNSTAFCSGTQDYITHADGGTVDSSGNPTWMVAWKAPATDKGTVKFYTAVNQTNDDGNTTGDEIATGNFSLPFGGAGITETATPNRLIKIFPNPATEKINILSASNFEHGIVSIFNIQGELISKSNVTDNNLNTINIQSLPVGNYIIELKNDKYLGVNYFNKQ
ncbi:MAG: hypothetical protein A3H98_09870 [Bacteroidetes bacterium RIFCSPLOWO2_02_FULL_36_8]|nr:MAG: hypothetical protein A3H98_09870 [Bacteroidetes bacterium RIFCSPLOWO2_02_FULL_36_8]OFY71993.1 MAG: hypothetical protein A3G23_00160 [Bacteroidetes bacterium RIFCSPLOWO2_12_FULL_37_12]